MPSSCWGWQCIWYINIFKHSFRNILKGSRQQITAFFIFFLYNRYEGHYLNSGVLLILNFYLEIVVPYVRTYLGVAWGFPGGYLGVSRGEPLLSPRQPPFFPRQMPFIGRANGYSATFIPEIEKKGINPQTGLVYTGRARIKRILF